MDEQDRRFIEALFEKQGEQLQQQLSGLSERFDHKLGGLAEQFDQKLDGLAEQFDQKLDGLAEQFDQKLDGLSERYDQKLADFSEESKRYVTAVSESFDLKIGMLAEGHQLLTEKLERIETQMDHMNLRIDRVELGLTQKLNQIAADVAAHRADTEAHSGVYSVREEHPQYTVVEPDPD